MSGIPYQAATDRPNDQFTMIHNDRMKSGPANLSGLAIALHHYLLSLPPGWTTTIDRISDTVLTGDSRERLRRANRELMNAGFVILHTERDQRGRFNKWYETFHNPQPEEVRTPSAGRVTSRRKTGVWSDQPKREFPQVAPDAGKPAAGKPAAGEPADISKTDNEERSSARAPAQRDRRSREPAKMTTIVLDEIKKLTGRTIDASEAEAITWDILGRATTDPTNPTGYVLDSIRKEPHRYLPTPIPPRFRDGAFM